ncbi:MAG: hypothetical protein ACT4QC_13215 [Planctomycetaceae bacterium]
MLEGLGPQFVVLRDTVQTHLKLSADQKRKLEDRLQGIIEEHMEFSQKTQDVKEADQAKEFAPYQKKAQEKMAAFLKETLKDEQLKRLRQIALQREGLLGTLDQPEVGAELKITEDQRKQLMGVMQEFQSKIAPVIREAQSGGDPEGLQRKVMKIRRELGAKAEAILTDAQKKQWQEMRGEPFALDD